MALIPISAANPQLRAGYGLASLADLEEKAVPEGQIEAPSGGLQSTEHQRIIRREINPERRDFYELCWLLGGSHGDIASLTDKEIDWGDRLIANKIVDIHQMPKVA